jgi:uncharacterized protein YdbL (DUF1318 family)
MKKLIFLALFIFALGAGSSWGMDLDSAKSQGLVGETPNGYLEAVKSATPEVNTLIKNVNSQRTKSGNYIKQNGKWVKK